MQQTFLTFLVFFATFPMMKFMFALKDCIKGKPRLINKPRPTREIDNWIP